MGHQTLQTNHSSGLLLPSMEADATSFARRCQACQVNSNMIHAPVVELHNLSTHGHSTPKSSISSILSNHVPEDTYGSYSKLNVTLSGSKQSQQLWLTSSVIMLSAVLVFPSISSPTMALPLSTLMFDNCLRI